MTHVLPEGVTLERRTTDFDADSTPTGLLRAHRVATGVWGRVQVTAGTLLFVFEPTDDAAAESILVSAGENLVIPPDVRHHVEPDPGVEFHVEFHK